MSNSPSRLVSRLAQLERARTASRDAVKVIIRYIDSEPQEIDRRVTAAGATGVVVVMVQSLATEPLSQATPPPVSIPESI